MLVSLLLSSLSTIKIMLLYCYHNLYLLKLVQLAYLSYHQHLVSKYLLVLLSAFACWTHCLELSDILLDIKLIAILIFTYFINLAYYLIILCLLCAYYVLIMYLLCTCSNLAWYRFYLVLSSLIRRFLFLSSLFYQLPYLLC